MTGSRTGCDYRCKTVYDSVFKGMVYQILKLLTSRRSSLLSIERMHLTMSTSPASSRLLTSGVVLKVGLKAAIRRLGALTKTSDCFKKLIRLV